VASAMPVEPELMAPIQALDDRIQVRDEPDPLPAVRFPGDHRGPDGFAHTEEQEARGSC
jgi:hypothetical protein